MICKKCGSEVAEDDVFCMQCGEKIERPQCPHCGAEVDEDTVFCSNCGEKIGQERCPYCGSELEEDSKFCVFCGAKTDGTEPTKPQITVPKPQTTTGQSNQPRYEKRPDTDTKGVWAIGAAIILAAIIAIACLGMGMDGTEDDDVAEDGYLTDELSDDDKDFAWLNEDFDDYLGNWVAYLDNGKPIYFKIWKDTGKYWFSMDASTSSRALYAETILDDIDEDIGIATGETDDEYTYLYAWITFYDGDLTVSTDMLDKGLQYSLDFDALECQPWTATDEAALNEFIFPYSDFENLKKLDIEGLSKEELKIARNEIYARHGRMFQDKSLQAYFNSCSWYTPSIAPEDFKESMLNEVEIANRDLIVSYEKEMGYQ